jgi:tetratricopeptide (TPR) repeat protein
MPSSSVRLWLAAFAISASVAFSSALRAPYVFDDHPAVRQNASIRQLLPLSVPLSPPRNTAVAGRPVVNVSLAINQAINQALGVDPSGPNATLGFHLGSLLIHFVTGLLLFAIIRRTLPRVDGASLLNADAFAGVTTLVWLLHPIQTEAVNYITQRTELLVSLFYLATIYAAVRAWDAQQPSQRRWLVAAVALCALGMASKEVMVTAPVMLLLYDRAFRSDSWRAIMSDRSRRWLYGGLFASAGFVAFTTLAGVRGQSVGFNLGLTWLDYAKTQCWAVAHYLRLIVWPNDLNFDYGDRAVEGLAWVPGAVVLSLLAIGAAFAWSRSRTRWLGFLGAWFFLLLAPSSSIVPIRTEVAAERRVYLASAAMIALAVVGLDRLRRRVKGGVVAQRLGYGSLAVALAVTTYQRGTIYNNTEALYRDVIAKSPENARGYLGVGLTLFARGPETAVDAEIMFRKAISVDTGSFTSWQSLGVLQLTQSRWQDAAYTFERALRINPDNLDAISGAARAYVELQDANAAMPYVDRLGAHNAPALWAMGNLLVRKGRGLEALRYLELAAATGKPSALGVALMSLAYAQSDNVVQAERAARVATANAGDTADVFNLAGRAMLVAKKTSEARSYLQQALALDPSSESIKLALETLDSLQKRRAQ